MGNTIPFFIFIYFLEGETMETQNWTLRLIDELDDTNEMIINQLSYQDIHYLRVGIVEYTGEEVDTKSNTVSIRTANYPRSVYCLSQRRKEIEITLESEYE